MTREVDVLVVGAGPAGLAAAARLARAGVGHVEVLERDPQAGGVPRYCARVGLGAGPQFARRLAQRAERAGAVVRTGVTALDWAGPLALTTVGAQGTETIRARAIVLATGARERPRAARLVPGTRPAGVYTTGELQQAVHLFGQPIGTRAVVVGAEDVSWAAAATVRAAGATVVAMVTDRETASIHRLWRAVPVLTGTTVAELLGHGRLSAVRVRHRDGRTALLPCDTVVFTGDFVPDDELARRGGPRPGVFAAGGAVHPGQRARAAAREGQRTADAVLAWWGG
ncbi:thioredoxin reductase [Streptomyces sp. SAI-170]